MPFSVFSIENVWRQVQVPTFLNLLATIWTLASVEESRTPSTVPFQVFKKTTGSSRDGWSGHSSHGTEITSRSSVDPCEKALYCGLPCNNERILVSSNGRLLLSKALITLSKQRIPRSLTRMFLMLPRLIRLRWRAWDRTRMDNWLQIQGRAWRASFLIFAAIIIAVTSHAETQSVLGGFVPSSLAGHGASAPW